MDIPVNRGGGPWNKTGAGVTITPAVALFALLAVCAWNELSYCQEAQQWNQRANWPVTDARITHIDKMNVMNSPVLRVDFDYNVNGKSYRAQQSDFKDKDYVGVGQDASGPYTTFASMDRLDRLESDFESNRAPTVHYNKTDPQEAFIEVGYSGYSAKMWGPHLATLITLTLLFIFVVLPNTNPSTTQNRT